MKIICIYQNQQIGILESFSCQQARSMAIVYVGSYSSKKKYIVGIIRFKKIDSKIADTVDKNSFSIMFCNNNGQISLENVVLLDENGNILSLKQCKVGNEYIFKEQK